MSSEPPPPPTESWGAMRRVLADWNDAAEALNTGDDAGIQTALAHYGERYRDALALTTLGAHLTAAQVVRVHAPPQPPPAGHKRVLITHVLDPSSEQTATERIAVHAVLLASTSDFTGVLDLVAGYSGQDEFGVQRHADLTMELLRMYVIYARQETSSIEKDTQS